MILTTNTASQKPHNYARGRSPTKTRCRPATSAVNKQLTAPKLCTQPARAAFNPAHTVNIDLTSALSFWPARRDCRRRQQDEPKLEEPGTVASHCLQADRSENRLAWLMRAGYFGLLQFFFVAAAAIDSRRLLQQGYIDWHLAQALCRCNATKLLLKYWSFELDRGAH